MRYTNSAHAPKDSRESGEENEATSGVDETGSRSCQGATGTCPTGAQSVISLPQTSQTSNTLSPILINQGFPPSLPCLIPSQNHQTLTFHKTNFFNIFSKIPLKSLSKSLYIEDLFFSFIPQNLSVKIRLFSPPLR